MDDSEITRIYDIAYRDDIPVVRAERKAIRAVFDAGVAEGIRQAREAVAESGMWYTDGDMVSTDVFAALDALGATP